MMCVVAKQHAKDGDTIQGLKMREEHFIPERGEIGEYTGTVVRGWRNKAFNIVQIDKSMHIDAEKEGNCKRYINH
jgi:hypothetical protein